eukprot:TRINITY_DN5725_c0_g3_i1.p1 TRINITY_DN5725_c0_g3~~TRINITY_DN5725_c0_g3_i1.p1  ORF type:complete len:358 (+),score=73.55 TRINITY_DN5725_c0_g3_i1:90-1163(+)
MMNMCHRSSGKSGYDFLFSKKDTQTLLITGGQGFIGAWIIKQLLWENQSIASPSTNRVVVFDLKEDNSIFDQVLTPSEISSVEREYGDIADTQRVQQLVEKVNPTSIIHLAGVKIPGCKSDPLRGAEVNVLGTLNVFESARIQKEKYGISPNVVYASSVSVLGQTEGSSVPLTDSSPYNPSTQYAVFKQTNEGDARVYWLDHQIPSIGLRPCVVYGVGKEMGFTSQPTKALKAAVLGKEYNIGFNGKLCLNYVEDVARIFIQCARLRSLSGAFALNIKGDVVTVDQWIEVLSKAVPTSTGKITRSEGEVSFAVNFLQTGLENLLQGQIPKTSIEKAVTRMLEIYDRLKGGGLLSDKV